MTLLIVVVGIALGVFAALALVLVYFMANQSVAEARLAKVTTAPETHFEFNLKDILSYGNHLLTPIRRMIGLSGSEDLSYRLSVAGYRGSEDVDTFLDAKLLCPVVGVLVGSFAGSGSNFMPFVLVLGAAGFFAPDVFLIWATNKRKKAISRGLPDAIDLLVICMEAGLGMDQAILKVAQEFESVSPELSDELMILCREQRAGKPRTEAWRSMADRVDLENVRHFSNMLTQCERLGTPISRALSQFADALRTKRMMTAEEKAAKTSVKLLFPLILFIFPAMFVVILGPAGIALSAAFEYSAK
jgi:tight adherence protein C